jgi:hypothetical protein
VTYRGLKSPVLMNARLPLREHDDPLRERFAAIVSTDGAVRARERGLFAVATSSGRAKIWAEQPLAADDFRNVSLFHDLCPCRERAAHCACVLAARHYHLTVEKKRGMWPDGELSLVYAFERESTLMDPEAAHAEIVGVPDAVALVSPEQLNASLAELPAALGAAAAAAAAATAAAMRAVSALPPLPNTVDAAVVRKRHEFLKSTQRLVDALVSHRAVAGRVAGELARHGGAQPLPARGQLGDGARIAAERGRAPVISPGFRPPALVRQTFGGGAAGGPVPQPARPLSGGDGGSGAGAGAGGGGALHGSAAAATASATGERRASSAAPDSPARQLERLGRGSAEEDRVARHVARLERRVGVLQVTLEMRDERIAELEEEAGDSDDHREYGCQAAYEDCARRARSVMAEYPESAAALDALAALARGFDRLALVTAYDRMARRARSLMNFERTARR